MSALRGTPVKNAAELYSLVGPMPKGLNKCSDLMKLYTVFKARKTENDHCWWEHYNIVSTEQGIPTSNCFDLIVLVDSSNTDCYNTHLIVANGMYVSETSRRENGIHLYKYTQAHFLTVDAAISMGLARDKKLQLVPSLSVAFSVNLKTFPLLHATFEVLCRAYFNANNAEKYIKEEARRVYSTVVSWPPLYRCVVLFSGTQIQWELNKACGSVTADVFSVMRIFPFLIAKRRGVISKGLITLNAWNSAEYILDMLDGYLHSILKNEKFVNAMELVRHSKVTKGLLSDKEHITLYDIMQSEQKKQKDLIEMVYVRNSGAPPCVVGIVNEWKENWNYKIRFQLAGILRSVSSAWGMDVMLLAETFISHMENSHMAKESIQHFISSCKRPLTQDTRPCISRKSPYSVSPHEFWCPFGGGEIGVNVCLSKRKFASNTNKHTQGSIMNIDTITPSLIWSTSTPN